MKWISKYRNSTGKEVYHTDENCPNIKSGKRKVTNSEIDYHDLRECHICTGEADTNEFEYIECPFCENKYGSLGNHLPACEEFNAELV